MVREIQKRGISVILTDDLRDEEIARIIPVKIFKQLSNNEEIRELIDSIREGK